MRLSIRWRLTLWNLLALALVLLGFAALVYGLTARALYQQIDRTLLAAYQQLVQDTRLTSARNERLRYWIFEFKEHENLSCVVYKSNGTVHERTEQLADDSIPPLPVSLSAAPLFYDLTVPILGRQRTLTAHLALPKQDFTFLLMAALDDVDREQERLFGALTMSIPVAMLLSGGVSYFMARKALTPIKQLRQLTDEVTAERLDRRVPILNPHDELGRLGQTINAMIARLEASFAEIRRFTADASHELRTPLTAIRTETEVALRKPLSLADYQHLMGSVLEECDRLTRLTDQLLTLAREDAGVAGPTCDPVDLAVLLRDVAETMRPLAEAKGVRLQAGAKDPLEAHGDPTRLRQVFYNLLDNAIKYTPPGGDVEVRWEQRDHAAVVTVRDTGIGIQAEHLPRVFDRFYRVDKARSRELGGTGGTGLGLSIAQNAVKAHGGRIELASVWGQGTTCTVILPQKPRA